jgi:hypothetical protein
MSQLLTDELDFDTIKLNIKSFLTAQDTFKDYNFEGSALSVLIDVLAYTTHYNGLYTNFVANEMFLDSASKYSSVVSLAKTIGYTPNSYRSAVATIDLVITLPSDETPNSHTIPKGTTFISPINGVDYTFSTITDYSAPRINDVYSFSGIKLYEGTKQSRTYTANDASQFVIPHAKVDTTTLRVSVRDSGSSSVINTFNYAADLLRVRANDLIYFIKQREDLFYEVYFGNDFIGKSIQNGNVVTLEYISSSGLAPNGAKRFTYYGGHRAEITYALTVVDVAIGGAEAETIESIKFNAPKAYTAQNRAVTVSDYETAIYNNFPNIQSVKVWGGQDNIPKAYGKVFVCAKPLGKEFLNTDEIDAIQEVLDARKVMTMIPVFVSPDFIRIEISVSVYYNPSSARKTNGEMLSTTRNVIEDYADTLGSFTASFRFSTLSAKIDASDPSIISNIMKIRLRNPMEPKYFSVANYSVEYGNPIFQKLGGGSLFSTRFYAADSADKCYLMDDGNGIINLFSESDAGIITKERAIGTVNYSTGSVKVSSLNVTGLYDAEFEIVFTPSSNDVVPVRQFILTAPSEYMTVNMIADTISGGDSQAGSNHIFTPSR